MTKRTMTLIASIFIAISLIATPAMAKQLKMVTSFSNKLPVAGEAFMYFIDQTRIISNGEIDFKWYDPGKLVPANAVLDTVSKGMVAAGMSASPLWAGKMPAAAMFLNVPFGPGPQERLAWLFQGNGLKLWQELYDNAGYNVKVIPILQIPSESAGWFSKPIETVADFKGLNMRIGGLGSQTMTKLGASCTMMSFGDVFTALERGVLDAAEASFPSVDAAIGFSKVLKYNYFPGWHSPAGTTELLINKDVWNKFTDQQKALIENVATATMLWSMAKGEATQYKVINKNAAEKGVKNMTFSPEIMTALKAAWGEVAVEMSAKDAAFKKIWDDLSAFRAEYASWKDLEAVKN